MSDQVDLQEFVSGFVAESDELVSAATAQLLEIEAGNTAGTLRPKAVRDLFRGLHTIKGLAGMIGVEPIVDLAHGLETVLRAADRAGGRLGAASVSLAVQVVQAISERVRAVADGRVPEPAPEALLEALATTDVSGPAAPPPAAPIPAWDQRMGAGERQQVMHAFAEGIPVYTVTFVPSENRSAQGHTIASVRAAMAAIGELVKVAPRATSAGVAFDLLIATRAGREALATAAATTDEAIVEIPPPAASAEGGSDAASAASLPARPVEDTASTAVAPIGRAVVRVELSRLDDLQELLSSLVVSRFRLERELVVQAERGVDVRRLRELADRQSLQLRELRRAILRARMVRMAEVLDPLALVVRSLVRPGSKEVKLVVDAHEAEVDKAVADRILPAIVHLVRNAVDHAIESPDERVAAGKPRVGTVQVNCTNIGNRLELVITDDGRGIDRAAIARRAGRTISDDSELLDVLTTPGFSTRDVVSQVSGRGLGMDIVRRIAVSDLGGDLEVRSVLGRGTTFTVRVPVTIAIVDVFSFALGAQSFVTPVATVDEIFELSDTHTHRPPSRAGTRAAVAMVERRGAVVSLVSLGELLSIDSTVPATKAIVVHRNGERLAFAVDRMLGRQEVVIRPIEDPLARRPGIAGATDLGDGRPTLVLDLVELGAGIARRQDALTAAARTS